MDPVVILAGTSLNWSTVLSLLVIPVLLPALVGLIGRLATIAPFWKRLLLALLALTSQVLTELVRSASTNTPYDLVNAIFIGLVAYAIAELSYQGLYKAPLTPIDARETGVITTLPEVASETAKVGDTSKTTVFNITQAPAIVAAPTIASKIAGKA